ncbi:UNVERIFIED_CONTAM: Ras-related protein RABA2a [Sesamum radiatum]|uniref:Ras-related protein RABA2a n=1 Tax=Sesamum radiatum TaxID=300843 RepID=A0AAW2S1A7_SESRA
MVGPIKLQEKFMLQIQASEVCQGPITEDEAFLKVLGLEKSSRLRGCGDGLKPPSKRGERINNEVIKENEELRKQAEEDRESLESLKKDNKEMYERLQTLESQVNNQERQVHSQVQAIIKSQLPTIIQNLRIFGQIHQPANVGGRSIKAQIWDTASQEIEIQSHNKCILPWCSSSIRRYKTNYVRNYKTHLKHLRAIATEDAQGFAEKKGLSFIEMSANGYAFGFTASTVMMAEF